jgi:hypothetical protein
VLAHLLALAGAHPVATTPLPAIGGLSVNSNPGFCNFDSVGQHATLDVNFAIANQDAAYEIHVLESGSLLATLPVSATTFNYSTPGDVENGGLSRTDYTFNFNVQVVRTADGVVMQDSPISYSGTYGTCR